MKALFIRNFVQEKIVATLILFSLMFWVYPHTSMAQSLQSSGQNSSALVFEIKNQSQTKTQSSLTIQNIIDNDPLPELLEQYLQSYNSPLSVYSKEIVQLPNWKKALAISYVEGNMGIHCSGSDNNCSGMGGAPGATTWRTYKTKLDWFTDLDKLLSKPLYSERFNTCSKMKGVYVQPGSASWVYGCEKIYSELTGLEEQAAQERAVSSPLALASFQVGPFAMK